MHSGLAPPCGGGRGPPHKGEAFLHPWTAPCGGIFALCGFLPTLLPVSLRPISGLPFGRPLSRLPPARRLRANYLPFYHVKFQLVTRTSSQLNAATMPPGLLEVRYVPLLRVCYG
jgi:hypothetical protein